MNNRSGDIRRSLPSVFLLQRSPDECGGDHIRGNDVSSTTVSDARRSRRAIAWISGLRYKCAIHATGHDTEPCHPGNNASANTVTDADTNRDALCFSHAGPAAASARCSTSACGAGPAAVITASELLPREQRGHLLPTWRILS